MPRLRRLVLLIALVPIVGHAQAPSDKPVAKIWVGRNQEIEEYLKTADCVSMRWSAANISAQCTLRPGGPIARMVWRTLPGIHRGFRESYKYEIAAYELDKLLKMDMVPPTVERQIDGSYGAAQQWVEHVVDALDPAVPSDRESRAHWENEHVRMAMFDNLIGNRDRNLRTRLHDAAWNLILIDQTRAFGVESDLVRKMSGIDDAYWVRIDGLTTKQLDEALGKWLDQNQIAAILARRERMRAEIKSRPN